MPSWDVKQKWAKRGADDGLDRGQREKATSPAVSDTL